MSDERKIGNSVLRVVREDITDIEIDAFVFYAREDLELGSGFGNAIAIRGGPSIQEELKKIGSAKPCEVVITEAGKLKAKHIIHAVGPKFMERDIEKKLKTTTLNALKSADEKGIERVAFPPMGAGFYGVPLPDSIRITLTTIKEYLSGQTNIKEVLVCGIDDREFRPMQSQLASLN